MNEPELSQQQLKKTLTSFCSSIIRPCTEKSKPIPADSVGVTRYILGSQSTHSWANKQRKVNIKIQVQDCGRKQHFSQINKNKKTTTIKNPLKKGHSGGGVSWTWTYLPTNITV